MLGAEVQRFFLKLDKADEKVFDVVYTEGDSSIAGRLFEMYTLYEEVLELLQNNISETILLESVGFSQRNAETKGYLLVEWLITW